MGISLRARVVLWGRSGGKCAICKKALVARGDPAEDDLSAIGDEVPLVARAADAKRGSCDVLGPEKRDQHTNLILLCQEDHRLIDAQAAKHTVERLRQIKAAHETQVAAGWSSEDKRRQQDDEVYASCIDEWSSHSDLDHWGDISAALISGDAPVVRKSWYDAARELAPWLLVRTWPGRYPRLEYALGNYAWVLSDLLSVFDRHADLEHDWDGYLHTRKFYKSREWDEARYSELVKKYDAHVSLVCDLFLELTRTANYVCDHVRECLYSGFRQDQGALVVRCNIGFDLRTSFLRPEYRVAERVEKPYRGLDDFRTRRYTRDCFIGGRQP